jgi:hypothetical protein
LIWGKRHMIAIFSSCHFFSLHKVPFWWTLPVVPEFSWSEAVSKDQSKGQSGPTLIPDM